jgi:hypothetical protein
MAPRLIEAGHELVLHDINRLPESEPFADVPFVQGNAQAGIGFDAAAAGCDLILHTPAWHGVHWRDKTTADFWRLNVDGTFWMFQAAVAAGIKRVVFLSSQAWHGHYDKYGFTKRVGEELCEYFRRNHGIANIAVRPADLTPWGSFTGYGARLLYGGVDREDVLDCIQKSVEFLTVDSQGEAPGVVVNAVRPNAFTPEQLEGWDGDPAGTCEAIFRGSRELVEKYQINITRRPDLPELGEGAARIGYAPSRHFGTFLDELRRMESEGGEEAVHARRCSY